MKILLINPPFYYSHPLASRKEPLGIAYVAAFLRYHGYDVEILDAIGGGVHKEGDHWRYGFSQEELRRRILAAKADIVGITCLYSIAAKGALEVASLVKEIDNKIITVMGGAHPTVFPEETMKDSNVDFIILGEGEKSFLDLVRSIEQAASLQDLAVDGCVYRVGTEVRINPKKTFIDNLDKLPFPARDLLPMEFYLTNKSLYFGLGLKRTCCISTSRGCPGNCSFCNMYLSHGHGFRARSAENVFEEIKFLVDHYRVEEIFFIDDNFTFNKDRVLQICELILKNNLNIRWNTPNGLHVNTLDEELLSIMKKAGCRNICIAIESGDEAVRTKVVGKNVLDEKIMEVAKICRKIKLPVIGFFIIGLPGENQTTFSNTVKLVKKLPLDMITASFALPFPGTRLYDECVRKGYINKDNYNSRVLDLKYTSPVIETEAFDKKTQNKWEKILYFEFIKSHFFRLFFKTLFFQNDLIKIQHISRFFSERFFRKLSLGDKE